MAHAKIESSAVIALADQMIKIAEAALLSKKLNRVSVYHEYVIENVRDNLNHLRRIRALAERFDPIFIDHNDAALLFSKTP